MSDKKHVLITGASRGIGRATALEFAKNGYVIWLNYHTHYKSAREVADLITNMGEEVHLIPFDVSNIEETKSAVSQIVPKYTLDALVLNAGIVKRGPLVRMQPLDNKRILDINLTSFFYITQPIIRSFLRQRSGSIVVVSSMVGVKAIPYHAAYSASKAGLIAASQALSQEMGPYGVRVNVVAPGYIDTDINSDVKEEQKPYIPLGRAGQPEEVARVIYFLCSERASYISGAVVPITGGIIV